MDFIERWFGFSPDGGDGSLEVLYLVAFVAVIAAIMFRRQMRRWLGPATRSRDK
jgi:hypothetical protein